MHLLASALARHHIPHLFMCSHAPARQSGWPTGTSCKQAAAAAAGRMGANVISNYNTRQPGPAAAAPSRWPVLSRGREVGSGASRHAPASHAKWNSLLPVLCIACSQHKPPPLPVPHLLPMLLGLGCIVACRIHPLLHQGVLDLRLGRQQLRNRHREQEGGRMKKGSMSVNVCWVVCVAHSAAATAAAVACFPRIRPSRPCATSPPPHPAAAAPVPPARPP